MCAAFRFSCPQVLRDGKLAGLQIFPEREKALEAAESPPG
jgi:hypothetical protein